MWFGADAPPAGGEALILAVWTFAGVVITQVVVLLAPIVKSRFERASTTTSQAQPTLTDTLALAKDIGQLDQRADDSDARFELIDRARAKDREDLDDVLDYLDEREPGWRGDS